ncbi:MAG: ABC transporter permease [Acidobacteriaceae bacterium]
MVKTLLKLCLREIKRIVSDPRIIALLVCGPFAYAFIFGGVYWNGRTTSVPIIIVDQDHSRLSRELTTALRSSDSLSIVGFANSPAELLPMARREEAYACVMFPMNFERDVLAGRAPRVAVVLDASNVLISGVAYRAAREVLGTYQIGADRRTLEATGIPNGSVAVVSRPIIMAGRQLFNPTSNYSYFLLIGLVCAASQSVIRMITGMSIGLDSYAALRQSVTADLPSLPWLFATKVAGTCCLAIPVVFGAAASVLTLFGMPHRGSLLLIFSALAVYVVIHVCMGFGYYGLCKSYILSTHLHLYMAPVLFFLSGFTWPYYAMPSAIQAIVQFIPIFHMNCIMRKVNLIGATAGWVFPHLLALAVWLVVAYAWGYAAFKRWCSAQSIAPSPAETPKGR